MAGCVLLCWCLLCLVLMPPLTQMILLLQPFIDVHVRFLLMCLG